MLRFHELAKRLPSNWEVEHIATAENAADLDPTELAVSGDIAHEAGS